MQILRMRGRKYLSLFHWRWEDLPFYCLVADSVNSETVPVCYAIFEQQHAATVSLKLQNWLTDLLVVLG